MAASFSRQVSHIFSDKTGTLTSNHMVFRRCIIGGIEYGVGETAISRAVRGDSAVAAPLRDKPNLPWASVRPSIAPYVSYQVLCVRSRVVARSRVSFVRK